jgi:hypothetical protein
MQALTMALSELQSELRDRAAEEDLLRQTISTLTKALQRTEEARAEALCKVEQVELELQGLTFIPYDPYKDERRKRKEKKKNRKTDKKLSKVKATKARLESVAKTAKSRSTAVDLDDMEDWSDEEEFEASYDEEAGSFHSTVSLQAPESAPLHTPSLPQQASPPPQPLKPRFKADNRMPVDLDIMDDLVNETAVDSASEYAKKAGAVPNKAADDYVWESPSQASFYRILQERDYAQTAAKRLSLDLIQSQEQIHKLQDQVKKYNASVSGESIKKTRLDPDDSRDVKVSRKTKSVNKVVLPQSVKSETDKHYEDDYRLSDLPDPVSDADRAAGLKDEEGTFLI